MRLEDKYRKEIKGWNWEGIKNDILKNSNDPDIVEVDEYDGTKRASTFLGTVFNIMPSGKYYMPWACSNVTAREAYRDEVFSEVLEAIAGQHGMYLFSGEGDPCDIFAGMVIE